MNLLLFIMESNSKDCYRLILGSSIFPAGRNSDRSATKIERVKSLMNNILPLVVISCSFVLIMTYQMKIYETNSNIRLTSNEKLLDQNECKTLNISIQLEINLELKCSSDALNI